MGSIKKLIKSLSHAFSGFGFILRREQNMKIELIAAALVIIAMIITQVRTWEAVVLTIMISAVLILETLNTALEQFINMLKPRVHPKAKILKDLMAAAVFLASITAAVVGILIFLPYIV
ncbi:MAG: diacylglycerol kinase family protein [Patescibacteria group bacterium]|nr:diacylglycerol kinase family protein [Patescibacteria group bacterium]